MYNVHIHALRIYTFDVCVQTYIHIVSIISSLLLSGTVNDAMGFAYTIK